MADTTPAAAATVHSLPDEVLRSIFHMIYHSQERFGTRGLLGAIRLFQPATAVSRRWRHISLPLFYRTAVVLVEADEDDLNFDMFIEYSARLSFNPRSNIGLILDNKRDGWVKEMVVSIHGLMLSPSVAMRALKLVGFHRTAWLSVKRLRFVQRVRDYEDDDDFGQGVLEKYNSFLSIGLPSLREIEYDDVFCRVTYRRFPLNALINEHIGGPTPLRSLKIFADMPPDIQHYLGLPIEIQRLHIDGVNFRKPLKIPRVLAESLVELNLSSVSANQLWSLFVPGSSSSSGRLVFARLRTLTLVFHWESESNTFQRNMIRVSYDDYGDSSDSDAPGRTNRNDRRHRRRRSNSSSSNNNNNNNGNWSDVDNESNKVAKSSSYMKSASFGTPAFPRLTDLEVRRFPGDIQEFLTLFASSPVASLTLAGLKSELPPTLMLSSFTQLKSLVVRYISPMEPEDMPYIEQSMQGILTTPPKALQSMSLSMATSSQIAFPGEMSFAQNLRSLSLLVNTDLDTVASLLSWLPSIWDLTIKDVRVDPVASNAQLIGRLKNARREDLEPVNRSLRRLLVPGLASATTAPNYNSHFGGAPPVDDTREHLKNYRGLLLLVIRLPSLFLLKTMDEVAVDVQRTVKTLVSSGTAAEFTAHLGGLSVKPWWL